MERNCDRCGRRYPSEFFVKGSYGFTWLCRLCRRGLDPTSYQKPPLIDSEASEQITVDSFD